MSTAVVPDSLLASVDERTRDLIARRHSSNLRRRGWLMRRMLLGADLVGLTVAFGIAQLLFFGPGEGDHVAAAYEMLIFGLSLPLWIVMAKLYGLYDRDEERADHSTADEVMGVFHLVTVGTWLLIAISYLTRIAHPQLPKLLMFWVLAAVGVASTRGVARIYCRRSVNYIQNTVIVGAGDVGQSIAHKVLKHPEYGLNLVGFIDVEPKEQRPDIGHLALLGGLGELRSVVRLLDVERVIIAFSNDQREDVVDAIRELNELDVQVDVVPRFFDVLSPAVDIHAVEGIPLLGLRPPRLSRSSAFLKRSVDIVGAAGGLLLLCPLLTVVAVWIKLDSRGPVLFRQTRMGLGNKTFAILKFRTMTADADLRKLEVAHLNKHLSPGIDARMFKIDHDPRVTRAGRFLRQFSVDELPQLWNVLRGDMSLVGPRPLILEEDQYVDAWRRRRLELKPGITGLWQVLGRSDIPFDDMVRLDYLYVTSWSLAGDLKLIVRTVPALLRGV